MTQNTTLEPVSLIIEDYNGWFSHIIKSSFYRPENLPDIVVPDSFTVWVDNIRAQKKVDSNLIDRLVQTHQYLIESGQKLVASRGTPDQKIFDFFIQCHEDFISRLVRLEIDSLLAASGIDQLTGFRTESVLIADLERELERRARRGNPFSICLTRIDGNYNADELVPLIAIATKAIQTCMRNFDDAYRLKANEFLVSLKHADTKGGIKFIERLNEELKNLSASFTMSSCIAEPIPGDDLSEMVKNIRMDLDKISLGGGGDVGQYEDVSPLQRFVKTMTQKSS
jgi:diguanylate cyclase